MAIKDEKRKSKLDKVKDSLYDKYADIHPKKRSSLHPRAVQAQDEWGDDDIKRKARFSKRQVSSKQKTLAWVKRFFMMSLGFFVLAGLFAGFRIFTGGNNSTGDINITILTQPFVDGGEDLPVTVQIVNNNSSQIETANIIFEYPTTSFSDGKIQRERIVLDTIRSGQTAFHDFNVRLFGEEGEERILTAKIEYRAQGSNAIVVKEIQEMVTIRSTPIQVLVEGRDTSIPSQSYTFDLIVNSNATQVTSNLMAKLEYPQGFIFESAEPAPSFDIDTWMLGDIEPGSNRTISITGKINGVSGETKVIRASVGEQDSKHERQISTVYGSQVRQVSLTPSFLDAKIVVDRKTGNRIIIPAAKKTQVSIEWKNTLPVQLQNVKLQAEISGNAYTSSNISNTDGFYDSNSNMITWDPVKNSILKVINPGQQNTFKFNIEPIPLASSDGRIITQPVVDIILRASGTDGVGKVQSAEVIASVQLVVNSDVRLDLKTQHTGGPFTNIGPIPPVVGQKTEYTLTWQITNSSNNLNDAMVTTRLPSYIDWLGITTPAGEKMTYNESTRELVWNLGQVTAGAGFTKKLREVSFKIAITPSMSQKNQAPQLTESLVFGAEDTYTNGPIRVVRDPHTTRLLNDVELDRGLVIE